MALRLDFTPVSWEQAFEVMEAQGYVIRPFLARYERLAYEQIEPRVSPETRLAVTVALDHDGEGHHVGLVAHVARQAGHAVECAGLGAHPLRRRRATEAIAGGAVDAAH